MVRGWGWGSCLDHGPNTVPKQGAVWPYQTPVAQVPTGGGGGEEGDCHIHFLSHGERAGGGGELQIEREERGGGGNRIFPFSAFSTSVCSTGIHFWQRAPQRDGNAKRVHRAQQSRVHASSLLFSHAICSPAPHPFICCTGHCFLTVLPTHLSGCRGGKTQQYDEN